MGIASIALDLGFSAGLRVYADSSAAIGICRRTGIGRERVRAGDVELIKWPGTDNPADMLTKAVNGDTI
eukprot:15446582-Alexandrium_andersonii.AAC.1